MAERIREAGQTHSMELIFFPLIILIMVGLVANEFQSSALQTTPVLPTPICTGTIEPGECYPTNVNGCDQSASVNCNFTANTKFSFLNQNSPYALLLSGNILGFFNCLVGCSQVTPVSNLVDLNGCISTGGSGQFVTSLYCAGASFNNPNVTVYPPYNATSSTGNNSNWFIQGLAINGNAGQNIYVYAAYLNVTSHNSTVFFNKYCDAVGICYNSPSVKCLYDNSMPWNASATQYCLFYVIKNTAAPNFSSTFTVFSFIGGIILLFLGLGLTVAFQVLSTGTTLGINAQATKMAQVFGLGLLSWGFVYSEFGASWLPFLPFNLNLIGFLLLTMMFFLGLYWRLFSFD